MGTLERRSQLRARREKIRNIALDTVKAAGVLALAVAVPNAVQGFSKLGLLPSARQHESMRRTYSRLVVGGYLKYEGKFLRLTPKGARELLRLELSAHGRARRRIWDKKWRVLVFDVPEKNRALRDRVRSTLRHIGFRRLQDSVWVYPYDCEDLIALLKVELRTGYKLLYMIVDELEGDARLKQEFRL
jgi:DNA-binding transcriptional regulator PaaX